MEILIGIFVAANSIPNYVELQFRVMFRYHTTYLQYYILL